MDKNNKFLDYLSEEDTDLILETLKMKYGNQVPKEFKPRSYRYSLSEILNILPKKFKCKPLNLNNRGMEVGLHFDFTFGYVYYLFSTGQVKRKFDKDSIMKNIVDATIWAILEVL